MRYAQNEEIHSRAQYCENYLHQAYEYVEKKIISYEAINILLSTASKFTVGVKVREKISATRKLAVKGVKQYKKLQTKKDRLNKKGVKGEERKKQLKPLKFSFRDEIRLGIHEALGELLSEKMKYQGELYDSIPDQYSVDLSSCDLDPKSITITTASIVVTTKVSINKREVEEYAPHIKYSKMEGNYYIIENAKLIGFSPSALPVKYNSEVLMKLAKQNNIAAQPIPKMIRHKTSNRMFFLVPEFPISLDTLFFADRQSNRSTSNLVDLTERCGGSKIGTTQVLKSLGCNDFEIERYLNRIFVGAYSGPGQFSKPALMSILTDLSHRELKLSLKQKREDFMLENKELYVAITSLEDDLASTGELSKIAKNDFSRLSSPTNEPETGLNITEYRNLNRAFTLMKRSALLSKDRLISAETVIDTLQRDKMLARINYHLYKELREQWSEIKKALVHHRNMLDVRRRVANNEEVELDDEEEKEDAQ